MRISRKLALGFFAVIATIVAMSAAIYWNLAATKAAQSQRVVVNQTLEDVRGAEHALISMENSFRALLLSNDPYYGERMEAHRARFGTHMNAVRERVSGNPDHVTMIDAAQTAADQWWTNIAQVGRRLAADPLQRGRLEQMVRAGGVADEYMNTADGALERVSTGARQAIGDARIVAEDAVRFNEIVLMIGLVLAITVATALGFALTRMIARPINTLTDVMGRLAAGDNTVEVPATTRGDEVGAIARAVLVFKEAALEKIRVESQAAQERSSNEADRNRSEAEKAREAGEDHAAIANLAEGLAALAEGDLTYRIEADFAPKTQKLKDDFNITAGRLEEAMTTITGAVRGMSSGTGEISQAADDLARRTEQQAASLEETAAALDEITATVRKTADGAQEAANVTGEARQGAERSGAVVRDAITAMAQIEKSSQEIGQIIGVIDEIAFQTNLLALNAGVEAARAGDAGKGFAVVASEVRALAQRSAEAAKEIRALISTSSQQVGQGVALVSQTSQALETIVTQVTRITGLVGEIAASAQEQATGLSQVNSAVNQMDQVTQQNAAMVEQSTAASHGLAREAEELTRLIARFRISGKAAAARDDMRQATPAAPVLAVAGQAASPARSTRPPVAQMKTVATGGGHAAALLAEEHDEHGWEEF